MIDFNNPFRPQVEQLIFPNEEAVNTMFVNMDEVLALITNGELNTQLLDINKAYLQQCLAYEAIQQDSRDLTKYVTVL